ncbi:DNA-directed RNA polymerase subunit alpha [Mycoplasmopsis gallopavonis]|uniref:DNA-directed RNA polymerase subunit alpha n=1 Tax=Mycoplasmopsis gallopavonis TaxID=76629 RepID=A0A449B0F0_9BACT|nr:DNA-directed RNA polymerase subunit alpha [Mycoplasmopsis gallopavonis]RIV16562.1 DNA-directed RNA polymerase subunit alpha [Mycoplasmopsis gallopavonis]VEU73243.1 DNA-directed RNA polymerase, alpha subunit [Mycoplasmopsis gallopavonis]
MEKMKKLVYQEKPNVKQIGEYETEFVLEGLERGYGNTLGVALRRTLLSSITSLAPFAIRIEGVEHEFQTIKDVVEDVPSLIMNLRKVRFSYRPEVIADNEIVKVTLNSEEKGVIHSRYLEVKNQAGIEVIDHNLHIAEVMSENALKLEIFLRPGRGFMSYEENKVFLSKKESELETDIKKGKFIAVDSNFSPIEKVRYNVTELNSSSNKIEERLEFVIKTDGTVKAKDALRTASEILIAHLQVIGDVENMSRVDLFEEEIKETESKDEQDIDITELNLSVRSLNALKRIKRTKLSQIASMKYEELEQTKNLGKKSIQEIVDKLKEHGYELKEGDE